MSFEFILRLIGMMVFTLLGALLGVDLSDALNLPPEATGLTFSLMGALIGLIVTPWLTTYPAQNARRIITRMSVETLIMSLVGLFVGMAAAALLTWPLSMLPEPFGPFLPTIAAAIVIYVTVMVFALRGHDVFLLFGGLWRGDPAAARAMSGLPNSNEILLDTSVIIDGRILDISRTGFIQGTMLVPRFVLNELQHVADSAEVLRRNRGKRGLEILSELQQHSLTPVHIVDDDIEGVNEVDDKLVMLAQQMGIPIMTQDHNLNRVADLQGVVVLNINELTNALKAVFLPGETMDIQIVMEGREEDQGVGYLDDGTMVVVEGGKRYMDRTIPVFVTRYIVTNAGRMYFTEPAGTGSLRK